MIIKIFFLKSSIPKIDALCKLKKMIRKRLICIIVFAAYSIVKRPRTIKIVVFTSILGSVLALGMSSAAGESWFPLIFTLILLGGIIVLFRIVSSVEPNKLNRGMFFGASTAAIVILLSLSQQLVILNRRIIVKVSFSRPMVSGFIAGIILLYFGMFTIVISIETGRLRSL